MRGFPLRTPWTTRSAGAGHNREISPGGQFLVSPRGQFRMSFDRLLILLSHKIQNQVYEVASSLKMS